LAWRLFDLACPSSYCSIQSPLKKRKRTDGSAIPAEQKEAGGEAGSQTPATPYSAAKAFVISGMDVHGHFLTIRNSTTTTGSLAGWTLRSQRKGSEYKFSSGVRLRPGESFKFRTLLPDGNKPAAEQEPDAWIPHDFWDSRGDMALLVNPKGEVKVMMEIVGEFPEVPATPAPGERPEGAPAGAVPATPAPPASMESAFSFDGTYATEGGSTAAAASTSGAPGDDNLPVGANGVQKKDSCIVM